MNDHRLRTRLVGTICLLALAVLGLSGCAEDLSTPVGVWEAVGEDTGHLSIDSNGEFEAAGLSFNLLQRRDADDDFYGVGTWRLSADETEIILTFDRASQGDFTVHPISTVDVDFRSGWMFFSDVEDTASIELKVDDPDE